MYWISIFGDQFLKDIFFIVHGVLNFVFHRKNANVNWKNATIDAYCGIPLLFNQNAAAKKNAGFNVQEG
jgi:hypothetical protein